MTPKQFFNLVSKMRSAQKEYFRTKSAKSLQDSKQYEKEVDAEIARVEKIIYERTNPKIDFV